MKPVLFVDIDGVMADSVSYWLRLYNDDHGTNWTLKDITEWKLDFLEHPISVYFNDYSNVQPVPDSLNCVGELMHFYRVVFATAGQGSNWLLGWIPDAEIIQVKDKSLLRGYALIDDYPLNLDVFIGERFLLSQPWNTNRGLNDSTWNEIKKHLMEVRIERFFAT